MTRPLIGLSIGRQFPAHPEYLRLRQTYPDAVVEAGGLPLLIPPMPDDQLRETLEHLDGMIFPGGADVNPNRYGENIHPTVHTDDVLDDLELRLARWSLEREAPVLGICRGQQLLNVALGGSLIQDLPSESKVHTQPEPRSDLSHAIQVEPSSRLAGIVGETQFMVNSFHHQAVKTLGQGLRPVAWSPDGVVEGFESQEHPWLLAVQFHPEDLVGIHEPSQRLFEAFVAACAGRAVTR